jgi:hypothetical protein
MIEIINHQFSLGLCYEYRILNPIFTKLERLNEDYKVFTYGSLILKEI